MAEKTDIIQSLNHSETEVLHFLFRDPNFRVREVANQLFRGEGGIRTNLTAIFDKLGVPDDEPNKREWVVREYSEAYQYVFHREEWDAQRVNQRVSEAPEIFIKPPDPIPVDKTEIQSSSEPPPPDSESTSITRRGLSRMDRILLISLGILIAVVFFIFGTFVGAYVEHYHYAYLANYNIPLLNWLSQGFILILTLLHSILN